MNVNVPRVAVRFVLEMMMFNILQTVAHLCLAGADLFSPQRPASAFNHDFAANRVENWFDDKLRSDRTGPQLRTGQIELISFFETVIRKFVPNRHSDARRTAVRFSH